MNETCSYPNGQMIEKTSLSVRNLRQYAWMQKFGFGTLWWVGENLWGSLLPKDGPNSYFQKKDRHNHPGLCISSVSDSIHAVAPMWYGTHSEPRCFPPPRHFVVRLDGAENDPTFFGYFRAVPIDRSLFGESPEARSKKQKRAKVKYEENHVVPFDQKRRLDESELAKLKIFIKENLSLVGVSA